MQQHLFVLLFVIVPFCSCSVVQWSCPTTWGPGIPCNCSGNSVVCTGNGKPYENQKVTHALGSMRGGPWNLFLMNFMFRQLPPDAGLAYHVTFEDCILGELRKPVQMEWPNTEVIQFLSVSSMHSLWSFIAGARALLSLTVKRSSMIPTIGEDFRQVPARVISLTLIHTGTSRIKPGSMAHLMDLGMIEIANMPIKHFPRRALAKELPRMRLFFLTDTLLEKLEPGFFDGMPNLEAVLMDGNKFKTLQSSWFTARMSRLGVITMHGNPLLCSCDLLWMKQQSKIKQSALQILHCYNADQNLVNVLHLDEKDYC